MNNNPFIFKNISVITNVASNIPIEKLDNNFMEQWVSNLNNKINDKDRLLFEYYADNDNSTIFYLILKIDSDKNNHKVLNIFRAESSNNIIWQYDLSSDFMHNIYKKGKSYFYNVMKNYYEVVEKQMEMYLYYLKNKISLSEMMNIIFIYNFFIKNNIAQTTINQFIYFMKNIEIEEKNIYNSINKIYLYFISLILKDAIEKNGKQIKKEKNSQLIDSFIFSIDYDLQFYFYFCSIDGSFFKNEFIDNLTSVDDLKNSIFYGKVQDYFNEEYLKVRIESEFVRGVSIKVNNMLLNENKINKSDKIRNVLNNNIEKLVILKTFIDSGVRFSNSSQISYLLIGGYDKYLFRDRKNKASYINLNINNRKAVTVLEQQIIEQDTNNEISYLISSININFTQNKITTKYEFEGVNKDFLLSNLRTYIIPTPITIIEPENSNSTHEIIENIIVPDLEKSPKILVFNFDEKCEELLTDSFYVSKEKREKKQIQQDIINDFIQNIINIKPAIVVVCTRNSISKTDKHYQHSIKDKILYLNKKSNKNVNYFPLLKVDSTLQSNVSSLKSVGKTLCGIRTRVYVDQKQLLFKYRERGLESYYGKGNELENFYEQNNSVIRVLSSNNKKNKNILSKRNTSTQIGSIIKYGAKRITNPNDKNKGAITINLVLELKNDPIKKQFIFCNYLPEKNIVSNFIANNNLNQKSIIPDNKNIYICFLTNKKSNQNI